MNSRGKDDKKYLVLSGGVGGAKLVLGLSHVLAAENLGIIANTGDDFVHHGLNISPDIDTLIYTLADLNNKTLGWGRSDETWNYMQACESLGLENWFRLGDRDLAIHLYRTQRLAQGASLSDVVCELCERFGIPGNIYPMSDDPVRTVIETDKGWLPFQEYFVKYRCEPVARKIAFDGLDMASPACAFLQALTDNMLHGVIVAPSNPFLSIHPILALTDIRQHLGAIDAPCVVVSPIVQGQALKGPTAKLMQELGLHCNVGAIANLYADIADGIVIDKLDASYIPEIEKSGLEILITDIVMESLEDKIRLAGEVIEFTWKISAQGRN